MVRLSKTSTGVQKQLFAARYDSSCIFYAHSVHLLFLIVVPLSLFLSSLVLPLATYNS